MSPTIIITGVITLSWLAVIGFHLWLHASDVRALRSQPSEAEVRRMEIIAGLHHNPHVPSGDDDLGRDVAWMVERHNGSGWYDDPSGFYSERWWSAGRWTNRVRGVDLRTGNIVERTDPGPLPLDQRYVNDVVAEMDRRLNEVES